MKAEKEVYVLSLLANEMGKEKSISFDKIVPTSVDLWEKGTTRHI